MKLDFTFAKFRELCEAISSSGYELLTVRDYLRGNNAPERFVILRHDIDVKPERGLKMAEIEKEHGIQSTYYIRMTEEVFKPLIIKKIAEMGHEIGYHYEVLDKAKGDTKKAIEIFKQELNKIREVCNVDTICAHGNSLTPWDNRSLWDDYNFKDYGIIGEAYLSINFENILYLSDTGRTWGNKYKVKDVVFNSYINDVNLSKIRTTNDAIRLLKQKKVNRICLSSHPWWSDSYAAWLREFLLQNVKNIGKRGIALYRHLK